MNRHLHGLLLPLMVVCTFAVTAHALYPIQVPQALQTRLQDPLERTFSLKLPLEQPEFHWTFLSRKDFLAGKLTLRIIRNDQVTQIVIFENGRISDGWQEMPFTKDPNCGEIYFGFISTRKYLTAPGDRLQLELTAVKDLEGIGPNQAGVLPAGTYAAEGSYTALTDQYSSEQADDIIKRAKKMHPQMQQNLLQKLREQYEYKAFLETWTGQWRLTITAETGWLSPRKVAQVKEALSKMESQPSPAPQLEQKKHSKKNWLWPAIPVIIALLALSVLIIAKRAKSQRSSS